MWWPWFLTSTAALVATVVLASLESPTAIETVTSRTTITSTRTHTSTITYSTSYCKPDFIGPLHWAYDKRPPYALATCSNLYKLPDSDDENSFSTFSVFKTPSRVHNDAVTAPLETLQLTSIVSESSSAVTKAPRSRSAMSQKTDRIISVQTLQSTSAASEKSSKTVVLKPPHPVTKSGMCDSEWNINTCETIISVYPNGDQASTTITPSPIADQVSVSTCPSTPPIPQSTSDGGNEDKAYSTVVVIDDFRTIFGPRMTASYRRPLHTLAPLPPEAQQIFTPGTYKLREIDWYSVQMVGMPMGENLKLVDDNGWVYPTELAASWIHAILPETMKPLKCPIHFHAEWIAWMQGNWLVPGSFRLPRGLPTPKGWPTNWMDHPTLRNPPMRYILTKKDEDKFGRFLSPGLFDTNKTVVIEEGQAKCIDKTWMKHGEL